MSQITLDSYQKAMASIDEAIVLREKQLRLMHQLKLSLFRERLVKINDNEHWIDRIPKKEAKKLCCTMKSPI